MYFVTKWAPTQGILEIADERVEIVGGYAYVAPVDTYGIRYQVLPQDWFHNDRPGAVRRAREMIAAKVKAHRRAIARLQQLNQDLGLEIKGAPCEDQW